MNASLQRPSETPEQAGSHTAPLGHQSHLTSPSPTEETGHLLHFLSSTKEERGCESNPGP